MSEKVKEHQILFTREMIGAIKAGDKTQTRRVMKPQPVWRDEAWFWESPRYDNGMGVNYFHTQTLDGIMSAWAKSSPYGQPGDRLWVREKHVLLKNSSQHATSDDATYACFPDGGQVFRKSGSIFAPDKTMAEDDRNWPSWVKSKWRSSIHMPRWASRLLLEVTDIRVQNLKAITDDDAKAEGIPFYDGYWRSVVHPVKGSLKCWPTVATAFEKLWDSINAKRGYSWNTNPRVWAVSFKILKGLSDA